MVIYADVLFIINFFITFLLLSLTARLGKCRAKTWRLIASSAFGGAYSMIILVSLPAWLSLLLKVLSAAVIVILAFGCARLKRLAALFFIYLFSGFLFLGIIIGVYFLFRCEKIAVSNSTVYFDISARGLLLSAFFAYVLACLIVRLHNRRAAVGEIYTLKIERQGQSVTLFALADSGNRLREPFSGAPVIVADVDKVSLLAPEGELRLIPASTVNCSSFLRAFQPDSVTIKNSKGSETAEAVYIAMSCDMPKDGYSAVFNPEILSV